MKIVKEEKKETKWRVDIEDKTLVFMAIEDTSSEEPPEVKFTVADTKSNEEITIDMSKERFFNLGNIIHLFNQENNFSSH